MKLKPLLDKVVLKKVEAVEAAEALIAFNIENAGEHNIRFVYRSNAFVYGLIITCVGIAAFACIIIFEDKLKKIKVVNVIFKVEEGIDK